MSRFVPPSDIPPVENFITSTPKQKLAKSFLIDLTEQESLLLEQAFRESRYKNKKDMVKTELFQALRKLLPA